MAQFSNLFVAAEHQLTLFRARNAVFNRAVHHEAAFRAWKADFREFVHRWGRFRAHDISEADSPGFAMKKSTAEWRCFFLVDHYDKFSNFFEDLLKLDKFVGKVEDELNISPE